MKTAYFKLFTALCIFFNGFNALYSQDIYFENTHTIVSEGASVFEVNVILSEDYPDEVSVYVEVVPDLSTAEEGNHYNLASAPTLVFFSGERQKNISISIPDNDLPEADRMLVLKLKNATMGVNIMQDRDTHVVYIKDNENHIGNNYPNSLGIDYLTSYSITGSNAGAEIVTYNPTASKLYVMNSEDTSIEVLDFSDPSNLNSLGKIDLSSYGTGGTSVAYHNNIIAASVLANPATDPGTVVLMDENGTVLKTVEVGAMPDMLCFTPDGTKILVANEGEPNGDYSIDPEGSISVIDLSNGVENLTQSDVTSINFNDFDAQKAQLIASGVRIYGENASVSKDLEPEYITVSKDSQTAFVSLQENNAIAKIDLNNNSVIGIYPLGLKDHSLEKNSLDTSNKLEDIFMASWPIKGMYMPDGIDTHVINGESYVFTANEGDARKYGSFKEEVKLSKIELNPAAFPDADFLKHEDRLGQLKVSKYSGDLDEDGKYEEIHVFGGRSFSIFKASDLSLVYDSGDDFERIIKENPQYNPVFNTTHKKNKRKDRSNEKGPEPEAVIVREINDAYYAFIVLERIGGFVVYNVSDVHNPIFEGYFNNRTTNGSTPTGDLAPESIIYIRPEDNATQKGLLVLANEVSASISVYKMGNVDLGERLLKEEKTTAFEMYPNPVKVGGKVFFNKPATYTVYDLGGRLIKVMNDAAFMTTQDLSKGVYIIKNEEGQSRKLIII